MIRINGGSLFELSVWLSVSYGWLFGWMFSGLFYGCLLSVC